MDEDVQQELEPQEVVGEYEDDNGAYYFAKHVDGIAHKVRSFSYSYNRRVLTRHSNSTRPASSRRTFRTSCRITVSAQKLIYSSWAWAKCDV